MNYETNLLTTEAQRPSAACGRIPETTFSLPRRGGTIEKVVWQLLPMSISNRKSAIDNRQFQSTPSTPAMASAFLTPAGDSIWTMVNHNPPHAWNQRETKDRRSPAPARGAYFSCISSM